MPRKSARNPNTYADVAAVIDTAMAAGGAAYQLPTRAKAVRWRQRAYALRAVLRELAQQTCMPGQAPSTRYDMMVLTIEEGTEKLQPTKVYINHRVAEGTLYDHSGKPLEAPKVQSINEDKLQAEMDDLLKNLS